MEISFDPEVEATIERIASESGRAPSQVVAELVTTQLDYDSWFRHEVQRGMASLDRGEYIDDEEIDARLDQILSA